MSGVCSAGVTFQTTWNPTKIAITNTVRCCSSAAVSAGSRTPRRRDRSGARGTRPPRSGRAPPSRCRRPSTAGSARTAVAVAACDFAGAAGAALPAAWRWCARPRLWRRLGLLHRRRGPPLLAALEDERRANRVVLVIDLVAPSRRPSRRGSANKFVPYRSLATFGRRRREIRVADDRDALVLDHLAGLGELAVAALLGGEIDDHRAGLHQLDHVGEPQLRCRLAGDQRGGDDDVDVLGLLAEQRVLGLEELLATSPSRSRPAPRRIPGSSR